MPPHPEEDGEEGSKRAEERDSKVVEVHGAKTSAVVGGLRLYSHYELTVAAFNSKGEGPRSKAFHVSTPEGGGSQKPLFFRVCSSQALTFCVST